MPMSALYKLVLPAACTRAVKDDRWEWRGSDVKTVSMLSATLSGIPALPPAGPEAA